MKGNQIKVANPAQGKVEAHIDAILAAEEPLIPSSGFLSSVMDRVHQEAAAPAPIPFPWKRAIPGIALAAAVFGWGAVELVRAGLQEGKSVSLAVVHLGPGLERPLEQAGWVAVALGISLASWLLTRRLTLRSELL